MGNTPIVASVSGAVFITPDNEQLKIAVAIHGPIAAVLS